MRDRTCIIDLNTKKYTLLKYKQYDNNVPIVFKIIENSQDVDLTGYTVGAFFYREDGNIYEKNTSINGSNVTTTIDNNITGLAGIVKVELVFVYNSKTVTSFSIYLNIEKSIDKEDAVTADPQWDIIKDLLTAGTPVNPIDDNLTATNKTWSSNKISSQIKDIENKSVCNVKDYGAIGNWQSHPAYETYNSLEELQKVYPNATSLSDEIDTLAIEKAINSNYKEIYVPYGGYKINKTLKLQQNQKLYGGGKHITQLDCDEELEKVILLEGSNITISELKFTTKFTNGVIGSPNNKTSCIWGDRKNHLTFDNLFIVGFNEAISLNENAYVTYMNRLRIQSCNMGIKAHGEFNNVSILQTSITYCNQCMDLGGGSNILIQGCDIERNNRGIVKKSIGDVNIRDSYFELNEVSSIEINWQTDFALIDGNSFFSHGSGQKDIIKYHTSPDKRIIISNNNYRSYEITGGKLKCLTPTNGTLVKPIFINNVMTDDYILGVAQNAINTETYYDNGLRVGFVSDISNGLTTDVPSIRGVFTNRGVINLPQLRDLNKVFKIVFVKSGEPLENEFMTLNSNTHDIVGHNRINPNQIYSIYFNRVVEGKEEIILCKG